MNSQLCLAWCIENGSRLPNDRITAQHVVDWLADKGMEAAMEEHEIQACEEAKRNAAAMLK